MCSAKFTIVFTWVMMLETLIALQRTLLVRMFSAANTGKLNQQWYKLIRYYFSLKNQEVDYCRHVLNSITVSGLIPLYFSQGFLSVFHSYQMDTTSPNLMSTLKLGKMGSCKLSVITAHFISKVKTYTHCLWLSHFFLFRSLSYGPLWLQGKLEKHICSFSGLRSGWDIGEGG